MELLSYLTFGTLEMYGTFSGILRALRVSHMDMQIFIIGRESMLKIADFDSSYMKQDRESDSRYKEL